MSILLIAVTWFASRYASKAEIDGLKAALEAQKQQTELLKQTDVKVVNDRYNAVTAHLDAVSSELAQVKAQNDALLNDYGTLSAFMEGFKRGSDSRFEELNHVLMERTTELAVILAKYGVLPTGEDPDAPTGDPSDSRQVD